MSGHAYLDWNASAPLRRQARAAMLAAMDVVGNPSSVHAEGRAARAIVETARGQVATLVGCEPQEVVFTSGATEAAALAFSGRDEVIASPVDHDCIWQHASHSTFHEPDRDGAVRLGEQFDSGVLSFARSGSTVALPVANSETGVRSPDAENVAYLRERLPEGVAIFVDPVQAVGRTAWRFATSGADQACIAGHKLGGPKGVGALVLRDGIELTTPRKGGGQELGRRSGTENVVGIAGFGAAAEAAARDLDRDVWSPVEKLRNILEARLEEIAPDTIFVGREAPRLPNTSCFAVPGWKAETQVMQLDLAGFAISAGSACSSGKVRRSRVLEAMGLGDEVAGSAIRVSIGPTTTEAEVMAFADAWEDHYRRRRRRAA